MVGKDRLLHMKIQNKRLVFSQKQVDIQQAAGAIFSTCQQYRYLLWRRWATRQPLVTFIGLNPSTADAHTDDATLRKCCRYAQSWGYSGLLLVNLFAYRSTDRSVLQHIKHPVGIDNDDYLLWAVAKSEQTILAWGNDGLLQERSAEILTKIPNPYCLRINKTGQPAHPLYLPQRLSPKPYRTI